MKAVLIAGLLATLLLFGCTQQQAPNNSTGSTVQEISGMENELSSYDPEFSDIDEMLNDSEIDQMQFIELEESAFK